MVILLLFFLIRKQGGSDCMQMKNKIDGVLRDLFSKLSYPDLQELEISDNSRQYLKKYTRNSSYFISFYSQVLEKSLRRIKKPVSESVFVDYGGGCGILSLLARLIGFKTVIYNDIYEKSLMDAKTISKQTGIPVDYFICGDAEAFVTQMNQLNIHPDLICSVDVLEHIYNLDSWFKSIIKFYNFTLIFVTGANSRNPIITHKLKRIHRISEYHGCEKNLRFEDRYFCTSFLEEREKIIRKKFPGLSENEIKYLSYESRGLKKEDIEDLIFRYFENGVFEYHPDHPTNTCDPYTGNWAERLIDLKKLKDTIKANSLTVDITNSIYCYSGNKSLNLIKMFVNLLIIISGPRCLFLSPFITIEIQK